MRSTSETLKATSIPEGDDFGVRFFVYFIAEKSARVVKLSSDSRIALDSAAFAAATIALKLITEEEEDDDDAPLSPT